MASRASAHATATGQVAAHARLSLRLAAALAAVTMPALFACSSGGGAALPDAGGSAPSSTPSSSEDGGAPSQTGPGPTGVSGHDAGVASWDSASGGPSVDSGTGGPAPPRLRRAGRRPHLRRRPDSERRLAHPRLRLHGLDVSRQRIGGGRPLDHRGRHAAQYGRRGIARRGSDDLRHRQGREPALARDVQHRHFLVGRLGRRRAPARASGDVRHRNLHVLRGGWSARVGHREHVPWLPQVVPDSDDRRVRELPYRRDGCPAVGPPPVK